MSKKKHEDEKDAEIQKLSEAVEALHRRMDEILDSLVNLPAPMRALWDGNACCLEALGEVQETPTEYIVTIDLPFVNKDDVEITVSEDQLAIQAKTRSEIHFERWGTLQQELRFQHFAKTVPLPSNVNTEKIQAHFQQGLLEIHLPKQKHPRKIPID